MIIIISSFSFSVYAADNVIDDSDYVLDSDFAFYASSDPPTQGFIYALYYECYQYLNDFESHMNGKFQSLWNHENDLYDRTITRIDSLETWTSGKFQSLWNHESDLYGDTITRINSLETWLTAKFQVLWDHESDLYQRTVTAINSVSSDIQDNANKNAEEQRKNDDRIADEQKKNDDKNAEEQRKNDNENTSKIGSWLSSLGDRIGEFFDNIFEKIKEFFISLFKPSDDYFDNLQADLDSYMSDHLGVVYELPAALLKNMLEIVDGLNNTADDGSLIIAVPEFAFKLKGTKYILLEAQEFNMMSTFWNDGWESSTLSALEIALVIMRGLVDLTLAVLCFRMIYKKIINKVGIEGGDDI